MTPLRTLSSDSVSASEEIALLMSSRLQEQKMNRIFCAAFTFSGVAILTMGAVLSYYYNSKEAAIVSSAVASSLVFMGLAIYCKNRKNRMALEQISI